MNKIEGFFKLIKDDEELQGVIKKVDSKLGKGKEEDKKVIEEEVMPIAKKRGFDFTAEEFLSYVDKAENGLKGTFSSEADSGKAEAVKSSKFGGGKLGKLALLIGGGATVGIGGVAAIRHFNQPKKADVAQVQTVETKDQEQENSDGNGSTEGEEVKNDGLRSEEVKDQAPGEGKTSENLKKELEKHNDGGGQKNQGAPAANAPAAEKSKDTPAAPPAMTKEKKIELVNEMLDKIINNVDGALDKGVEEANKMGQNITKEQVIEEYKKLRDQGTDEQKLYLYNMMVSQMMGGGAGGMN